MYTQLPCHLIVMRTGKVDVVMWPVQLLSRLWYFARSHCQSVPSSRLARSRFKLAQGSSPITRNLNGRVRLVLVGLVGDGCHEKGALTNAGQARAIRESADRSGGARRQQVSA